LLVRPAHLDPPSATPNNESDYHSIRKTNFRSLLSSGYFA
jgi:hypothetical protein